MEGLIKCLYVGLFAALHERGYQEDFQVEAVIIIVLI